MAKRTKVVMIDDLNGEEIIGAGKTVTFGHLGSTYEIDLTEKNADRLHEALAPYIAAARRVTNRRSAGQEPDLQAIRTWAKESGVKVSARGRVSRQVQDAYRAAH